MRLKPHVPSFEYSPEDIPRFQGELRRQVESGDGDNDQMRRLVRRLGHAYLSLPGAHVRMKTPRVVPSFVASVDGELQKFHGPHVVLGYEGKITLANADSRSGGHLTVRATGIEAHPVRSFAPAWVELGTLAFRDETSGEPAEVIYLVDAMGITTCFGLVDPGATEDVTELAQALVALPENPAVVFPGRRSYGL